MGLSVSHLKVASFLLVFGSILPAQAEVTNCKEIAALPAIVNTPGIWCLKKNLASAATTGNAIDVQVGAVTIDLNGWTLTGSVSPATLAVGIRSLNRTNVTIRNGTIRGFFLGISLEGPGSTNDVIEEMHVDQARSTGIKVYQAARTVIRNNLVTNTGGNVDFAIGMDTFQTKFLVAANNIINGVTGNQSVVGISTSQAEGADIRDNSVLNVVGGNTAVGISNSGTFFATIQNNRILNGTTIGTTGMSSGGPVSCINNVIHRYTTATACLFNSGNVTPPN